MVWEMDWRRLVAAAGLVVLGTVFTMPANASLLSADSEFGSGTVTQDTETGLEWLDPLLGVMPGGGCCLTYNQISAEFGAGGLFDGFRFATRQELETLFFVSAGIDLASPTKSQAIGGLIGLLGDTFSADIGGDTFLATSAFFDDGDPASAGLASLTVISGSSFFNGTANIFDAPQDPNSNPNPFGAWLVRAFVDTSVDVSEPPLLGLLALAFGWMGRRRFTRRTSC